MMGEKPTIEELEKILADPNVPDPVLMPNGEVRVPETSKSALAVALAAARAEGEKIGEKRGLEKAAQIARRGSDIPRGWVKSHTDERTDGLLYSALREGQEIEKAIKAEAERL